MNPTTPTCGANASAFAQHPGYRRMFAPDQLTLGIFMPLRFYDGNMQALAGQARLVGDIDRGGVIASLVGTHTILPDEDRAQIVGYIINKFRGDVRLFDDGYRLIAARTGWRGFGVLPFFADAAQGPAGGHALWARAEDGTRLRLAHWPTDGAARGTV